MGPSASDGFCLGPLPNESVSIDEFLHVVRTHTLSAFDYLSR